MTYKQEVLQYITKADKWVTESDIMKKFERYKFGKIGDKKFLGDWGTTNKVLKRLMSEGKVFRAKIYDERIKRSCYHYTLQGKPGPKVETSEKVSQDRIAKATNDVLKDLYDSIKDLPEYTLTTMRAKSDLIDRAIEKYQKPVAIKFNSDGFVVDTANYGKEMFIGKYYADERDEMRVIFINTDEFDYEFIKEYKVSGSKSKYLPALKFFKKKF